jgi:CHAT domain-containing protein/tetratricopeptide (TPR) repeat protein
VNSSLISRLTKEYGMFDKPPLFDKELSAVMEKASELLESGEPLNALEWYTEAERLALLAGDEAALCSLLGDKAVAFRRLGNIRRAIETYQQAIELSRKVNDALNLSRWSANLGQIFLMRGEYGAAERCFKEGMSAALKTGRADQISIAMGNYASLLGEQDRYQEAIESIDQAIASAPGNLMLHDILRHKKYQIYEQWGTQLSEEGQVAEALDAYTNAINSLDLGTVEEVRQAAVLHMRISTLYEQQNDLQLALLASDQASQLFRDLGDLYLMNKMETARRALSTQHPNWRSADIEAGGVENLYEAISSAIVRGNQEEEATARMSLCSTLLLEQDERATEAFEETLAFVRRRKDRRRELLLCLNFALHFLEGGQPSRARTLAERAFKLSQRGLVAHKIIASLNLGQVWREGFSEPRKAIDYYRTAVQLLKEYRQEDPDGANDLLKHWNTSLAKAASTMLDIGLFDEAEDIVALLDPETAAKIAQVRKNEQPSVTVPDVAALREMTDAKLDPVLAGWRAARTEEPTARSTRGRKIFQRMEDLADVLGWTEVQTLLTRAPGRVHVREASRGGPAGMLHLAQMVASQEVMLKQAQSLANVLAIPDDELECMSLFAMQDRVLSENGVAFTLLRLCAVNAADPRLAARFYGLLGMFSPSGNEESELEFYLAGEARLAGGTYNAERAHLRNEAAVVLTALGRCEEALEMARSARELAEAAGETKLAAMATGNLGHALMKLERWEEALAVFEPLVGLQSSIGDTEGLANTRLNLSACYVKLGRYEQVQFDEENTDPDHLFSQADFLGLQGDYDRAIRLFEHAFNLLAASEEPYEHEAEVRSNFARTLHSAGRSRDAIEQMKLSAELFGEKGDQRHLHEAYSWLAGATIEDPLTCEYHAERALQLGRQLGDLGALAIDLGHLGQAKLSVGQYEEALRALEEANTLLDRAELKALLADALVGVGQAKEAISIYENQLALAEAAGDNRKQVRLLVGLAEAKHRLVEEPESLSLLHKAHAKAVTLGNDELEVQVANRLGLALLESNKLDEAARVLEEGIDQARTLGLWRTELALLSNLGQVLKEMRDLEGAERTLIRVRSESRARGARQSEAKALAALGDIAANQDQFERALSNYLEAADLAQEANDRNVEAACLDGTGNMYSLLGKPERAIEYHRRASKLHAELEMWGDQIVDLINLVQAYIALNEVEKVGLSLSEAQVVATHHEITNPGWSLPFTAGRVAALQGVWDQARGNFRDAILQLESIRHSLKTPLQQRQWALDKATVYDLAAEAAIRASDGAAAIEFIECNKTRFLQAITLRRTHRPRSVDEATWLRYERAADRRSELQARRRSGLASGSPDLDRQVRATEAEFAKALAAVQVTGEEEFENLSEFIFPFWSDLAQSIPHTHAAVSLAVYPGGLGIVCIGRGISGKAWATAKLDGTFAKVDLDRLIFGDHEVLRSALADGELARIQPESLGWVLSWMVPGAIGLWSKTVSHVCGVLGERVWPAILEVLPTHVQNVILMPGAGFNVLPLHAARLPNGSRVDERFCISYVPSLGVLGQIQNHQQLPPSLHFGQAMNPTEDEHLPFSIIEAREAALSLGSSSTKILSGRKATVERTLTLLKNSDVFHFSGHAFYDVQEPFRSGLFCSPRRNKSGILTLATILDRMSTIRSRFVILSACETGQVQADDALNDFLGLPGGFVAVGANAVLATLWRVDDLATCLLLGKFFELWNRDNQSAPEALLAAQQWLRSKVTVKDVCEKLAAWLEDSLDLNEKLSVVHGRWLAKLDQSAHPFEDEIYWAAFYITGLLHPPGTLS